ncbi:MAG: AEC family transporter [Clostridia bacterium]|nr:AEC family transporter [Clostridia bacterium]
MIDFFDVFLAVIFLLVLAVPGFIFAKLKMFPQTASATLSTIVLYGCQPILIFTSFQGSAFTSKIAFNMLLVAIIALAAHFLMFAIVKLLFFRWRKDEKVKLVKYLSAFSNCGFMGLPFLQSLFTDAALQAEVVIYCAVVLVVFNILNWTFGVYILTEDKKEISLKKILLNPVIIAVIISVIMFFTMQKPLMDFAETGTIGYKIISKLTNTLNFLSNMVTPLSMFVIGIRLANINLKQLLTDKWAYASVAVKLILMSFVTMFLVAYLPIASTIKYTIFFLLSMPSATSGAMMAVQYKKDSDFASVAVVLSTIGSIITLPILYLFMSAVLGVTI